MIRRALGIALVLTAVAALPALAGEECSAHKSADAVAKAVHGTQGVAAQHPAIRCADALSRAERTVKEIDDGVAIEFRSKDRELLDTIVRLANEGRIFGDGTPGNTVPRRIKRDRRTVTLTATSRSSDELNRIRSAASSLRSPNPECGERLADASGTAQEG